MLDYTSSVSYETGYLKRHMEHAGIYSDIKRLFGGKKETGVRVYEAMNKFCDSDLFGISNSRKYVQNQFFSVAARMLSDNTVPCLLYTSGPAAFFSAHLPSPLFMQCFKNKVKPQR